MPENEKYFKVGAFLLIALIVFLLALTMLGHMKEYLQPKAQLMTMVSESVQGLTQGSAVKYQGVPIGTVREITINPQGNRIRIDMEIMLSKFRTRLDDNSKAPQIEKKAFFHYLEQEIQNGLRCKLEPDGITGMKYIELEFVKEVSAEPFMQPGFEDSNVFYVPSVPSLFNDLRTRVVSILDKLEALDYAGLTAKAEKTLTSADLLLNDPRLTAIIKNLDDSSRNIADIADNLNQNISREQIARFVTEVDQIIQAVENLSLSAKEQLQDASVGKTFEDLREALDVLKSSGYALMETMSKINAGVESVTDLADSIDADPASLIYGKGQTETEKK